MGTEYKGYAELLNDFKRYQKQTPKGVSLQNKRNNTILLRFKVGNKYKARGCNCSFTLDGMVSALNKAHKVAEALKTHTSETDFLDWYDSEILEKGKIENDVLTFGEAIEIVEIDFWAKPDRRKRKRDKSSPNDRATWDRVYGCFYRKLSLGAIVSADKIIEALDNWGVGTKSRKDGLRAYKKLVRASRNKKILNELDKIDVTQTEYAKLQSITIEQFLKWHDKALTEIIPKKDYPIQGNYRCWLWVFSMQVVYGLRIHEVFAIKNLRQTINTDDGVQIKSLWDGQNTNNLIIIGNSTGLGTSTKTGYRLAIPLIGNDEMGLIDKLKLTLPILLQGGERQQYPKEDCMATTRLLSISCYVCLDA